jgi:uncharacterized RDD family membrane protein YckC
VPGGPQAPAGPQAPGYGGPVPPGGWQQPMQPATPGWAGRPLASWGARLGAYVIDAIIVLIPVVVLFFVIAAGAVGVSGDDDVSWLAALGWLVLWVLASAVVVLLYAPSLMARQGRGNGQTWGKQMLGIRVVRNSGEPMTFWPAALREVGLKWIAVSVASAIIPVIPWFLDYFWPLWDDENRALHDMAASTHVVRG